MFRIFSDLLYKPKTFLYMVFKFLFIKKKWNEFRDHSCFDLMGRKYNIYMYGLKIIYFYNKLLSACMCPVQVCLCETKIDKAMETLYFLMNNDFVGSKSRWIALLVEMTMGYNRVYSI